MPMLLYVMSPAAANTSVVTTRRCLSVEDVLPFLPDFVAIDAFKDEIVSALGVYSGKIQRFKDEVAECDLTCDSLLEEIDILRGSPVKCPR